MAEACEPARLESQYRCLNDKILKAAKPAGLLTTADDVVDQLCLTSVTGTNPDVAPFGHGMALEFEYSGERARDTPSRCWSCRRFSARFPRKDKDLAGINKIWISDLLPVRFVNDGVSHARAVAETTDAPEAVATGNDRGRDLGHGGR